MVNWWNVFCISKKYRIKTGIFVEHKEDLVFPLFKKCVKSLVVGYKLAHDYLIDDQVSFFITYMFWKYPHKNI